jgi:hypothetical protein
MDHEQAAYFENHRRSHMQEPEQAKIVANQPYPDRRATKVLSTMQQAISSPRSTVSVRHPAPSVREVGICDAPNEQKECRELKDAGLLPVLQRQCGEPSFAWLAFWCMMVSGRAPGCSMEQAS